MSSRTINRLKKNNHNGFREARRIARFMKAMIQMEQNLPTHTKAEVDEAHRRGIQYALDYTYTDDYPGLSLGQIEGYEVCRDLIREAVQDAAR